MPIATQRSQVSQKPTNPIPVIHDSTVGSNVVDTSYHPLASLMMLVEGSPWIVNWYSAVISKDTELAGQDIGQLPIYQQYKKINRLEIKIDQAVQWTQDDETKHFNATGSARVHSSIIPNLGDMFAADIGDGREGIFTITSSVQGSAFKDTVYLVNFSLVYIASEEPEKKIDLEKKVILNTHYVKEFLRYGKDPIIITETYNNLQELKVKYKEIINNYFRWFFNTEYSTLILPGQTVKIYDHFLVKFIFNILNSNDHLNIKRIKRFNIEDDDLLKERTIWDAILEQDINVLKDCVETTGLTNTSSFNTNPFFESIYYSNMDYIVYPKNHATIFNDKRLKPLAAQSLTEVSTTINNLKQVIYDNEIIIGENKIKNIRSVLSDEYYVLSGNFYNDYENKTLLEIMAHNHLQKEKNDSKHLLSLLNTHYSWGGLEKFYYLPILMVLIRSCVKGF